jgi:hypothetical protein
MTHYPFRITGPVKYKDVNMYRSEVEIGFVAIDGFRGILEKNTYFRIGSTGIILVDLTSNGLKEGLPLNDIKISVDEL